MTQYNLKNVFHLEYDNMLYVDLQELLPIFVDKYKGIAATFDNDKRCIPGFIYIRNQEVMSRLADFFAYYAKKGYNDMQMLAEFKNKYGENSIDYLPIITAEYAKEHPLVSRKGNAAHKKKKFFQYIDLFHSVFDAAALGQYLGGQDPNNGSCAPGFINESCVFNSSHLGYDWYNDDLNRKIPYIVYSNKKYRINNLHIHSKKLELFTSSSFE